MPSAYIISHSKELGLLAEFAALGQGVSKMMSEHLVKPERKLLKITRVLSNGLRSQLEKVSSSQRWNNLILLRTEAAMG